MKEKEKRSTSDGFVLPGAKTAQESNRHPRQLDTARVDELRKVGGIKDHFKCYDFPLNQFEVRLFVRPSVRPIDFLK